MLCRHLSHFGMLQNCYQDREFLHVMWWRDAQSLPMLTLLTIINRYQWYNEFDEEALLYDIIKKRLHWKWWHQDHTYNNGSNSNYLIRSRADFTKNWFVLPSVSTNWHSQWLISWFKKTSIHVEENNILRNTWRLCLLRYNQLVVFNC